MAWICHITLCYFCFWVKFNCATLRFPVSDHLHLQRSADLFPLDRHVWRPSCRACGTTQQSCLPSEQVGGNAAILIEPYILLTADTNRFQYLIDMLISQRGRDVLGGLPGQSGLRRLCSWWARRHNNLIQATEFNSYNSFDTSKRIRSRGSDPDPPVMVLY